MSGIIEAPHFFRFNRYGSCFYYSQKFSDIFLLLRNPCFFPALLVFPSNFLLCTAFCFSHIRLLSNFPAFLCSYSYLKTVLIAFTFFCLPFHCIYWFISQLFKCYVTYTYIFKTAYALCSALYGGFSHKYTIRLIYSF